MNLQIIKGRDGQDEYVLLPVSVYRALRGQIEDELSEQAIQPGREGEYEPFDPADFVQNPVALARMRAGITQAELARRMGASLASVHQLEQAATVSADVVQRVTEALEK
ncbi:MAG: helix-turn-helix transcriptional regulator [Magnetococcus sp. MYC-9]